MLSKNEGIIVRSVILLRGINVGGHAKLPMKELCEILNQLGAKNPRHYIQSGNIVIDGTVDNETLSQAIEAAKGFKPHVLVLSQEMFMEITARPPVSEPDGKLLHIWFTTAPFTFNHAKAETLRAKTETIFLLENAIYLHAPEGIGRSKLASKMEALAGVSCTARNMNTVRKLLLMLEG